jgi:hypothetical protein
MALNYQFYNNTLEDVRNEITRRQNAYWPNGSINNEALAWNYQKTAYIILKALKVTYTPETTQRGPYVARENERVVNTFSGQLPTRTTPASYKIGVNEDAPVKRIQTPTAPILELYGPNYTQSTGTIRGAVLNSAEIKAEGTYGSILRITVNFTVFDKEELDNYMNSFLRPGCDIGLEYGWTINEFEGKDIKVNKGEIYGTVFNFSFSAKEDGTWECSLQAYGPSLMTYGFNTDAKDPENTKSDPSNFATYGLMEIFKTIEDNKAYFYGIGEVVVGTEDNARCKKIFASQIAASSLSPFDVSLVNKTVGEFATEFKKVNSDNKEGPVVYIYEVPLSVLTTKTYGGGTTTKLGKNTYAPYITLNNLIEFINSKIDKISKRGLPKYSFISDGKNVCVGSKYNAFFKQTGPADVSKFAFTTQRNGPPGSPIQTVYSLKGSRESFAKDLDADNVPLQHLILISTNFILSELNKIISGDKNAQDKKIVSFLKLIFSQLETETGGAIVLELMPERDVNGNIKSILILNKNGVPDNALDNIRPFSIPMMTKGSVVRAMSIESKVPDAIVTEVATFTRAGVNYGNERTENINLETSKEIIATLNTKLKNLNDNWLDNLESGGKPENRASSLEQWQTSVRDTYRKLVSLQESLTLNIDGSLGGINNILDLKTAVFPIYLKLTLDGINGFLYGNAITTNWLPTQYRDSRIYWTVTDIRHRIENNDWITELEAIYRVKEK